MRGITRWVFWVLACVLIGIPVGAQAVTLNPTSLDVVVVPGEAAEGTLYLYNDGNQTKYYSIEVVQVDLSGQGSLSVSSLSDAWKSWVTLSDSELELAALEEGYVSVSIEPPADTDPEMLTLAIQVIEQENETSGIAVQTGALAYVFVTVDPDGIEANYAASLSPDTPVSWGLPVTMSLTIQNDGPMLVQPAGSLEIVSLFGRDVDTIEINPGGYRILAGEQRTYEADWGEEQEEAFLGGALRAELANFAIGAFRVEPNLTAWTDGPELEVDSTWVIVIPRYTIQTLLELIALVWLVWFLVGWHKRKTKK